MSKAKGVIKLLRPEAIARYIQLPINRSLPLLGLDVGMTKVGIAITDSDRSLAYPLARVDKKPTHPSPEFPSYFAKRLAEVIQEHKACGLVVGYPLTFWTGQPGAQCTKVFSFMEKVYQCDEVDIAVPFALWDERMTTQEARETLLESGHRRKGRRQLVEDQVAATLILESFLSTHVHTT